MTTYKTPDVYIEEIATFPPSVAEVGTAIPAFVGYTEFATKNRPGDLELVPTKIYSLKEYEQYFGGAHAPDIHVKVKTVSEGVFAVDSLELPDSTYVLAHAVRLYFANGGGVCYVVSVGPYADDGALKAAALLTGLEAVAREDEPTLLVVPEAALLKTKYADVAQASLSQAGTLMDRFAILDVQGADHELSDNDITNTRGNFGSGHLAYGAAYYPFVETTINHPVRESAASDGEPNSNVKVAVDDQEERDLVSFKTTSADANPNTAIYNFVKQVLGDHYIVMPASGAIAGVYAATDAARGVWKAPANVALAGVLRPMVKIDNKRQENLNVDTTAGKSINALRAFAGKGTMVWGARTLAGNDNEWRYVSVRRFFNTVEESVKKATSWAVFEPNDANTWVKVRGMIENYLIDKWRDGALAGATPKEAFFVKCGLGSTMNAQDILEGRMNVEVGMAVVRPAEFIVLKFSHKLQTS